MANKKWLTVIGLEVHVQLKTVTKLFSTSPNAFGVTPNALVNAFDAAYPGVLPVTNEFAIEQALKLCLLTEAKINRLTSFDRKGYFYPDLPAGFQITQHYAPLGVDGRVNIADYGQEPKWVGIENLHLEQDAGKLVHDHAANKSLVDLNRAGVPLVEIVSKPDMSSAEEAVNFVNKLRALLVYFDISDGNMQEGSLRVDANVSIHQEGEPWGERCEIKNLNSKRFLKAAINSEVTRQKKILEAGGQVDRNSCLFDEKSGLTYIMRGKQTVGEYGYFPDPDLPSLTITDELLAKVKASTYETPEQVAEKLAATHGLKKQLAMEIAEDRLLLDFYQTVQEQVSHTPAFVAQWLVFGLMNVLKEVSLDIKEAKIETDHFIKMLAMIDSGQLNKQSARAIFLEVSNSGDQPEIVLTRLGLGQVNDEEVIAVLVDEALAANPQELATLLAGKESLKQWFIGQIMRLSKGKANPNLVKQVFAKKLAQLGKK